MSTQKKMEDLNKHQVKPIPQATSETTVRDGKWISNSYVDKKRFQKPWYKRLGKALKSNIIYVVHLIYTMVVYLAWVMVTYLAFKSLVVLLTPPA